MRPLRVAAHVHSAWSYDAEWRLQDLALAFRRLRYDIVLMAEHDRGFDQPRWEEYQRACEAASTQELLLVPGMEYADPDNVVHTVVWGNGIEFLGESRPTLEVLRDAHERDAVTLMAHPGRRDAISRYRAEWRPFLTAVEIWNRKYDGVAPNAEAGSFAAGEALAPFVSLDFHTGRQFFPLAMSLALEHAPSAPAVLEAIHAGACQPRLLGVPALRFTAGPEAAAVHGLERVRRRVRGPLRRLEQTVRRPATPPS